MIARLRRHRWLASLLLFASPASLGQVLPVLHPCAIDMPWLATAHGGMAPMPGMPAETGAQAPGHGGSHQHNCCTCVGCCCTPAITDPPQAPVQQVVETAPRHVAWPVVEAAIDDNFVVDFLPPSTAPPLV